MGKISFQYLKPNLNYDLDMTCKSNVALWSNLLMENQGYTTILDLGYLYVHLLIDITNRLLLNMFLFSVIFSAGIFLVWFSLTRSRLNEWYCICLSPCPPVNSHRLYFLITLSPNSQMSWLTSKFLSRCLPFTVSYHKVNISGLLCGIA